MSNIKELHEALSNAMYWAIEMNHPSTDELRNIWRRVDAEYKNIAYLESYKHLRHGKTNKT